MVVGEGSGGESEPRQLHRGVAARCQAHRVVPPDVSTPDPPQYPRPSAYIYI